MKIKRYIKESWNSSAYLLAFAGVWLILINHYYGLKTMLLFAVIFGGCIGIWSAVSKKFFPKKRSNYG